MNNEEHIRASLRKWIVDAADTASLEKVGDDTPLFRSGVLKSVQVTDLILYIEELSERSVNVEQIKPGVFRDIDTIYRHFFSPDHA